MVHGENESIDFNSKVTMRDWNEDLRSVDISKQKEGENGWHFLPLIKKDVQAIAYL